MTSGWLTRLAEADAGLPDEESAARTLAAGGPEDRRVLAALAATRAELAAIPPTRLPASVAARLAAGLDGLDSAAPAPVVTLTRRRRRPLLLTAAAAALVALVLLGPPAPTPPTDLAAAASRVVAEGVREVGPLADPQALAACLARAGAAPAGGPLLAGRPVVVGGREGTLLVLGTGVLGRVRAVVPAADCVAVLGDLTVGG
ncbi:hypothetical protein GCM10009836_42110 [Pseudonocardia ailaonensis]|uniref:Anti-sigma-M factor RsmA n=1 Tax=Pseudonocardia ailaonensis TaxID=367279 RepID=A0ABN2N991_9PSEU